MRSPIQRSTAKAPPTPVTATAAMVRRRITTSRGRRDRPPTLVDEQRARALHLGQRPLAVAGREVDRPDRVDEDAGLVAEGDGVEDGRLHAVVRGEAADDDPPHAVVRAGARPAPSATVAPDSGSRIVKPE